MDRRRLNKQGPPAKLGVLLIGLIDAGAIEPPLDLERCYLDQELTARIETDGRVTCMGRSFCTLSSAASFARGTCAEPLIDAAEKLSSNGWAFWQYRTREGELENIGRLRRRYLRG